MNIEHSFLSSICVPSLCITATSKLKLYFRAMSTQGNETVDLESRWWMLEEERQRREKEEIEKRWVAQVGTIHGWANKGLFDIYL